MLFLIFFFLDFFIAEVIVFTFIEEVHTFFQVAAVDVNSDGQLEIIATDASGNVLCFSPTGEVVWENQLSGTATAGARVADLDLDGQLEVILTTNDG